MVVYKVKCMRLPDEDGNEYETYGLAAMEKDYELMTIDDVSVHKAEMEALACMCNRGGLALQHMMDVIEDWLSS